MRLYFQQNTNRILLSESRLTLAQRGSLIAETQQVTEGEPVRRLPVVRCG